MNGFYHVVGIKNFKGGVYCFNALHANTVQLLPYYWVMSFVSVANTMECRCIVCASGVFEVGSLEMSLYREGLVLWQHVVVNMMGDLFDGCLQWWHCYGFKMGVAMA